MQVLVGAVYTQHSLDQVTSYSQIGESIKYHQDILSHLLERRVFSSFKALAGTSMALLAYTSKVRLRKILIDNNR